MSWYRTGTVTVTNGSPTVTGSGTSWLTAVGAGWGFRGPDGRVYEVLSVGSNVALTLAENYLGTTAAGQSYAAYPTQSEIRQLASEVASLIVDYATVRDTAASGKFQAGSDAAPGVASVSDTNTGIRWPAADALSMVTAGLERIRITSTGNVGIGTATPLTPLDVNHATDSRVRLMLGGVGTMQMQSVSGANRLASSTADPLEFWTNGVRRVSINSVGNIGLGTGSPLYNVHVAGATPALLLDETDAAANEGKWRAYVSAGSFAIGTVNDANSGTEIAYRMTRAGSVVTGHIFEVADVVSLQVDAAGNVGVGPSAPAARLHVQAGGDVAKLRLQNTGSGVASFGQASGGVELLAASMNATNKYTPAIKFGSTDPNLVTTNPKFGAAITAEATLTFADDADGGMALAFWTAPTASGGNTAAGLLIERARIDPAGNLIFSAPSAAPGLSVNGQVVFNLTSNTNLRISARGTDGVTRVANITLS